MGSKIHDYFSLELQIKIVYLFIYLFIYLYIVLLGKYCDFNIYQIFIRFYFLSLETKIALEKKIENSEQFMNEEWEGVKEEK